MRLPHQLFFLSLLMGAAVPSLQAQVVLDGSLGPRGSLPGPDFRITPDMGKEIGPNLFHSFSQFDIPTGDSATFVGLPGLENIIARITGNAPSQIFGAVRTEMAPGVSLWLINPAGIVFGANASLDVNGSVYLSTASSLQLGGGQGSFDAADPSKTTLSAAPPSAFVFSHGAPAPIQINGATLNVAPGATLGLVGGDITLSNSHIAAPGGQVFVDSVAASGAAAINSAGGIDASAFSAHGSVTIAQDPSLPDANKAAIDVGGQNAAGSVSIRAGKFFLTGAEIADNNFSESGNGSIDITADSQAVFTGAAAIVTDTYTDAAAGDIHISAPSVSMQDTTIVSAYTHGAGNGGDIRIDAQQLALGGSTEISSNTYASGDGGSIDLNATSALTMADNSRVDIITFGSGNAGSVNVATGTLALTGNATIDTQAFVTSSGNGGDININASSVTLTGSGQGNPGDSAEITAETDGAGHGGAISINAGSVTLDQRALITSSSTSRGGAGTIAITTSGNLKLDNQSEIQAQASGSGQGGDIDLHAARLDMANGSRISVESTGSGNAGTLEIAASDGMSLSDSSITTAAATADGGNIILILGGLAFLDNSVIETSVRSGVGNGGNITVSRPDLLVLHDSRIQANAFGGNGGNITITTGQLVPSSDSIIEASSQLGLAGGIVINAPDNDIGAGLTPLPADFAARKDLLADACGNRGGDKSRLIIRGQIPLRSDSVQVGSQGAGVGLALACNAGAR